MQMRKFMFIHAESYRPPFIPPASSANQHSALCTAAVKQSCPGKGTPECMIVPWKHRAEKSVSCKHLLRFPSCILCLHSFEQDSLSIPHHNLLRVTSWQIFWVDNLPGEFSGCFLWPVLQFGLIEIFLPLTQKEFAARPGQLRLCWAWILPVSSLCYLKQTWFLISEPDILPCTILLCLLCCFIKFQNSPFTLD